MKNYKYFAIFSFLIIVVLINSALITYIKSVKTEHTNFLLLTIKKEAQTIFDNIIATRQWNANHNGVYVKQNQNIKPNPYLKDNQLLSKKDELLIKINPAWMTRQIFDIANKNNNYIYNITSLRPNNPTNKSSLFETKALQTFEKNPKEPYYFQANKELRSFQFMGALKANESCLKCHVKQNYKLGDVVGGISITIPLSQYSEELFQIENNHKNISTIIIWVSVFLFIVIAFIIHLFFKKNAVIEKNIKELESLKNEHETYIKRYKYAVEGSQSGTWDWDLLTNEVYLDKNWKAMLGYEEHEIPNSFEEWDKRVHPDDKEQALADIQANQDKKTQYYLNVHRLRHKNYRWVWILDRGRTYFDEKGKAIRMVGFHTDITEFKELELKLYEKEQNLLTAQEIAHMGYWRYNTTSDAFEVSASFYTLLNINKDVLFSSYSDFKHFIHEDDVNEFIKQHNIAFQTKVPTSIQYRMRKNGSNEILEINEYISFVYNEQVNEESFIGTIQDVTSMKKAQQELQLFKQIIDNSPISIIITDERANIIYVNKYFTKTTGYSEKEVLGQNPRLLKSDNTSLEEYEELWQTLQNKKTWGGIFKNINKNKKEFWETAMIIPILDEQEQIKNYLAIKREITKEVYLEKELREKEELMLVQSKNAAMGEMISMIAHQWRQPITTISMMANNILADIELEVFEEQTAKKFAQELSKQTQYLSKTIEDFRNFFKQDKAAEEIKLEVIFDDIDSIISASLKNNNIDLIVNYDKSIVLKTYTRELLQVLINLIKNSKEAFEDKHIKNAKIVVDVSEGEKTLTIKVSDNAGGIAKEHMENIFNAYFTTKEGQNGTGLGLYMSRMIVEKHLKGSMMVSNTQDGAMFRISLQKFL